MLRSKALKSKFQNNNLLRLFTYMIPISPIQCHHIAAALPSDSLCSTRHHPSQVLLDILYGRPPGTSHSKSASHLQHNTELSIGHKTAHCQHRAEPLRAKLCTIQHESKLHSAKLLKRDSKTEFISAK